MSIARRKGWPYNLVVSQPSTQPFPAEASAPDAGHHVACIAYDGLAVFEFGIVSEIFGRKRPELERELYRFSVCAVEEGILRSDSGLDLSVPIDWQTLESADTIVIPGWRDISQPPPARLVQALRDAHQRDVRLVSICSGVFVLAAAGLIDNRRVTTHWHYAERLGQLYPTARVNQDVLYVKDGNILTSAGSAAGIDLCLHLVRQDHGTAIANSVARRLVMPAHRDGGQSQFIPSPIDEPERSGIALLLDWIDRNLDRSLGLEDLAQQAAMSKRTLTRRFKERTGMTPLRFLNLRRIDRARGLLEDSDWTIEKIAHSVGFASGQILRLHFRRVVGTTPQRYRDSFTRVQA
jgi:AraC family transcriptional activator FtrA